MCIRDRASGGTEQWSSALPHHALLDTFRGHAAKHWACCQALWLRRVEAETCFAREPTIAP
eukprot:3585447-Alexandrium_andersonii.AAC.1